MFFYLLCEPPFSWPLSDESGSAAVVNGPWPSFVLLSQERLNKNVTGETKNTPAHYVGLLKAISVHINRILILNCHWNIHVEVLGETCKHSSGRVVIRTSLVSYFNVNYCTYELKRTSAVVYISFRNRINTTCWFDDFSHSNFGIFFFCVLGRKSWIVRKQNVI